MGHSIDLLRYISHNWQREKEERRKREIVSAGMTPMK